MIDTIRLLMSRQLKCSKLTQKTGGFTLFELLIAMVLAFLVVTPLLTFMVNITDNDRTEQAKATSEQEIQSAIDYISHDLQEAVYIYDAAGINLINNQLPIATGGVPVLVFWKRNFYRSAVKVITPSNPSPTCPSATPNSCNDAFVYSLVAYYLIKDNNSTWSNTARIGRFEIHDGVKDPNDATGTSYLPDPYSQDKGFKLFDLTLSGTLQNKMNAWTKDPSVSYTASILPLVDYIDQTPSTATLPPPPPVNCTSTTSPDSQLVSAPSSPTTTPPNGIYSFYACVDSSRTLAQVYIRGNALARIKTLPTVPIYDPSKASYFPTAIIQIKGRGLLGG